MTLKNFVRETAKSAEVFFDPDDAMLAHIVAERLDGKIDMFACPMQDATEEALFRVGVPAKLKAEGQHRWWCFFSEAYDAHYGPGEESIEPRHHPRRIEVVVFVAESRTGDAVHATRQIWRPDDGPARLLPLVFSRRPARFFPVGRKASK